MATSIVTLTFTPKEVRSFGPPASFVSRQVTVADGQTATLEVGTIMGEITSGDDDGLFGPYDPDATDGRETAVGILIENVDATTTTKGSGIWVKGQFVESELTGLDAAGKTDLGGRSITETGDFIF